MQNRVQSSLCCRVGVCGLCKHPRCFFVDIFVCAANDNPDFFQCHVERKLVHLLFHLGSRADASSAEICVDFIHCRRNRIRNSAAVIFFDHGNGSGNKVSEVVCQIVVHSLQHYFVCENPVLSEGIFTKQEIFQSVNAVSFDEDNRVDHIRTLGSFRLGNFFAAHKKPAVTAHLLRKRKTRTHKHCRPDDAVESYNFLAHKVNISGPVFVVKLRIIRIAECCDVVCQSVKPYINYMLLVKRNRDSPVEC